MSRLIGDRKKKSTQTTTAGQTRSPINVVVSVIHPILELYSDHQLMQVKLARRVCFLYHSTRKLHARDLGTEHQSNN
jgi:hypothetical protein